MDARLQRRIQRYGWDRAAPHYERLWSEALAPATTAVLDLAQIRSGEQVLDVACGSGVLTRAAWAAAAPNGRVIGCDISADMLAEAALRSPGCEFVRTDAQSVDGVLPAARFDVVLCGLGLMYVPDPEAAVAAMLRCLRPGGRMVASVWGERKACGWAEIFPIVDARVQSEVCPMFFRLGGADALATALRGSGLTEVRTERIHTELAYADAETACAAAFVGGPVALAYSRFDEPTRDAVHSDYRASIQHYSDGAGYRIPGDFVVGIGRRP
jgi:ubiquinone/menaquinone biosynthesis C-methylase UbiE